MSEQGQTNGWWIDAVSGDTFLVAPDGTRQQSFSLLYELNALQQRLTDAEAERDRLRARTHEIQERADKTIAPLEKFHRITKEQTLPFMRRHGWHPDDGGPNARYWYGYLWEREKQRLTDAQDTASKALAILAGEIADLRDAERDYKTRLTDAEERAKAVEAERENYRAWLIRQRDEGRANWDAYQWQLLSQTPATKVVTDD